MLPPTGDSSLADSEVALDSHRDPVTSHTALDRDRNLDPSRSLLRPALGARQPTTRPFQRCRECSPDVSTGAARPDAKPRAARRLPATQTESRAKLALSVFGFRRSTGVSTDATTTNFHTPHRERPPALGTGMDPDDRKSSIHPTPNRFDRRPAGTASDPHHATTT